MFESLKDTFDKSVATVSVKSESLVESSRTKAALNNTQKRLDAALNELGRVAFSQWQNNCLTQESVAEQCQQVQQLAQEVESLSRRIEKIKEEENNILGASKKTTFRTPVNAASPIVQRAPQSAAPEGAVCYCSNCGKKLDADARFCDECGATVER